jgi:protein SCO1/2
MVWFLWRATPFPVQAQAANASSLPESALNTIRFEQKLNSQVSLDLPFLDEQGNPVTLRRYVGQRPVILVLGYYRCPMLCTLVLNGMVECLLDLKLAVGREFEVVNVSIDPNEKPELAAAKKRTYLKRYGRLGADQGWHFLTGEKPAIERLAAEVGFNYAYDATIRQYAHPSGLIILTPQGKVARYLFGVNFSPKELDAALREASANQIGSPIRQLILLCFHYHPWVGRYGGLVMAVVRLAGVATLLGLGGIIVLATRHSQRRPGLGLPLAKETVAPTSQAGETTEGDR